MVRRTAVALIAFFALALTTNAALAHEGHDHKIIGTVTMAAADHVMLKDKDGKEVTVKVTCCDQCHSGERQVVHCEDDRGRCGAERHQVGFTQRVKEGVDEELSAFCHARAYHAVLCDGTCQCQASRVEAWR